MEAIEAAPAAAPSELPDAPLVLYDGTCGLCAKAVRFILAHERDHDLVFAPLQGPTGALARARYPGSRRRSTPSCTSATVAPTCAARRCSTRRVTCAPRGDGATRCAGSRASCSISATVWSQPCATGSGATPTRAGWSRRSSAGGSCRSGATAVNSSFPGALARGGASRWIGPVCTPCGVVTLRHIRTACRRLEICGEICGISVAVTRENGQRGASWSCPTSTSGSSSSPSRTTRSICSSETGPSDRGTPARSASRATTSSEIVGRSFAQFFPPARPRGRQADAAPRRGARDRVGSRTSAGAFARTARSSGRASRSRRCAIAAAATSGSRRSRAISPTAATARSSRRPTRSCGPPTRTGGPTPTRRAGASSRGRPRPSGAACAAGTPCTPTTSARSASGGRRRRREASAVRGAVPAAPARRRVRLDGGARDPVPRRRRARPRMVRRHVRHLRPQARRAPDRARAPAVDDDAAQHRRRGDLDRRARQRAVHEPGRGAAHRVERTRKPPGARCTRCSRSSTRRPARAVENPVEKVLREGVVVGLANHTVLRRRERHRASDRRQRRADPRSPTARSTASCWCSATRSEEKRELLRRTFLATATEELIERGGLPRRARAHRPARGAAAGRLGRASTSRCPAADRTQQLAVAHVDPAKVEFARELGRRYPPDPNAATGVAQRDADRPVRALPARSRASCSKARRRRRRAPPDHPRARSAVRARGSAARQGAGVRHDHVRARRLGAPLQRARSRARRGPRAPRRR